MSVSSIRWFGGNEQLLMKLNYIREDLGLQPRAKARDYRSE